MDCFKILDIIGISLQVVGLLILVKSDQWRLLESRGNAHGALLIFRISLLLVVLGMLVQLATVVMRP